jgi:hypothetical protein
MTLKQGSDLVLGLLQHEGLVNGVELLIAVVDAVLDVRLVPAVRVGVLSAQVHEVVHVVEHVVLPTDVLVIAHATCRLEFVALAAAEEALTGKVLM